MGRLHTDAETRRCDLRPRIGNGGVVTWSRDRVAQEKIFVAQANILARAIFLQIIHRYISQL